MAPTPLQIKAGDSNCRSQPLDSPTAAMSGRRPRCLQQGALPRKAKDIVDPDKPIGATKYNHVALGSGMAPAMPWETLQYETIFDIFKNDDNHHRKDGYH